MFRFIKFLADLFPDWLYKLLKKHPFFLVYLVIAIYIILLLKKLVSLLLKNFM